MDATSELINGKAYMPKEVKYDVYISYSHLDFLDENDMPREVSPVKKLIDCLTDHGVSFWMDMREVYLGKRFSERVTDAIGQSKMMVLVSSRFSNLSEYVAKEVLYACRYHLPIIILRLDTSPYSRELDLLLGSLSYIDYFHDSESAFNNLLKSIETELCRMESGGKEQAFRINNHVHSFENEWYKHRNISDIHRGGSIGNKSCVQKELRNLDFKCLTEEIDALYDKLDTLINEVNTLKDENSVLKAKLSYYQKPLNSLLIHNNNHGYVDLNLPSRKLWAICNVGAANEVPSDCGAFFAWGETSQKDIYEWDNYKFSIKITSSDHLKLSKYVLDNGEEYGTPDGISELDVDDDAARIIWGGSWRMPTIVDWQELIDNCTYVYTELNGIKGGMFTGRNGNSIFLPVAGWRDGKMHLSTNEVCCYWSSSIKKEVGDTLRPCKYSMLTSHPYLGYLSRRCGLPIRPVIDIIDSQQ